MRVILDLIRSDCRAWLRHLAATLEAAGHSVGFRVRADDAPDRAIDALLGFERLVYGVGGDAWRPIDPDSLPQAHDERAECEIEFSTAPVRADALALLVDGGPGIAQVARALVEGHVPLIEIVDGTGQSRAAGLPAAEEADLVGRSLDLITARVATLCLMALDGQARAEPARDTPDRGEGASPLRFGLNSFEKRVKAKLTARAGRAEHWRVGIRPRVASEIEGDQPIRGFRLMPDDGARYYADPILWEEEGKDFLFLEEFPYATARGIIAFTELDASGMPRFAPRPIIERGGHLSYPFLFRHAGSIYMIPENAAEGHVPLYRARRFPEDWEFLGPLVTEPLHDATLFETEGRFWLFGNATPGGGSSWDCLAIHHAASPLGPFVPHRANPVLVDARVTRSGGPVLAVNGRLVRPVQSCLGGYGRFLRLCEITALDTGSFEQRQVGRLVAPLGGPIGGVHTYSRSSRFEAIDALTPRRFDIDRFNAGR